ncbi:M35 family metallo-endopeptidase [Sulfurimonas sp.]|uniref:M35 family metallo-endopeptidase n=1 Tax=Sulfurimonas sp. TaxID=2022749 RepID=UPI003D0EA5CD
MALEIKLSHSKTNKIKVTLTNKYAYSIKLLKWNTPFDAIVLNCFDIKLQDEEPCKYKGPYAKRIFKKTKSTIEIKSKESITQEINLSDFYHLNAEALYSVSLKYNDVLVIKGEKKSKLDDFKPIKLKSNIVKAHLYPTNRINKYFNKINNNTIPNKKRIKTIDAIPSCPPNNICYLSYNDGGECYRTKYLSFPRIYPNNNSQTYILKNDYLNLNKKEILKKIKIKNDSLYKKWFGVYNNTRSSHVKKVINGIFSNRICKNFEMFITNTNCEDDTIAWFWPSPDINEYYHRLGVCYKNYFKLKSNGFNSKPGTLAHELSHGYGKTNSNLKEIYGIKNCQNLARKTPEYAIRNADNYQYFLEEYLNF